MPFQLEFSGRKMINHLVKNCTLIISKGQIQKRVFEKRLLSHKAGIFHSCNLCILLQPLLCFLISVLNFGFFKDLWTISTSTLKIWHICQVNLFSLRMPNLGNSVLYQIVQFVIGFI